MKDVVKRNSRSTSCRAILAQPVCHVSQSLPGRLKSTPMIILGDNVL